MSLSWSGQPSLTMDYVWILFHDQLALVLHSSVLRRYSVEGIIRYGQGPSPSEEFRPLRTLFDSAGDVTIGSARASFHVSNDPWYVLGSNSDHCLFNETSTNSHRSPEVQTLRSALLRGGWCSGRPVLIRVAKWLASHWCDPRKFMRHTAMLRTLLRAVVSTQRLARAGPLPFREAIVRRQRRRTAKATYHYQ